MLAKRWEGRQPPANEIATDVPQTETVTLKVKVMTCSHCAAAVTRALHQFPEVAAVHVALQSTEAVIRGSGCSPSALAQVVHDLGYEAAPADRRLPAAQRST